jgi:hypothetical protein
MIFRYLAAEAREIRGNASVRTVGIPADNSRAQALTLNNFRGCRQSQQYFPGCFYQYYIPTKCFGPYETSSGGIYTCQYLGKLSIAYTLVFFGDFSPLSLRMWWILSY